MDKNGIYQKEKCIIPQCKKHQLFLLNRKFNKINDFIYARSFNVDSFDFTTMIFK